MAFPASNGVLSDVLEQASRAALRMKQQATIVRDTLAAGNVTSHYVVNIEAQLRSYRQEFTAAASVEGIGPYAQAQLGDPTLDVAAEFTAMTGAVDGVIGWIRANFPTDANGFLLERTWGADGPVLRQFTPAQTAGLRTQLDALIATVA